jgi:catechol 2,3-dioxygenase-like lactoylglutathione lyase family enzyme
VIAGLDHVQLAAPPGCEPAARAFYGQLLGMRELEKPAALRSHGGCWFAAGDQQLHVGVVQAFAPAAKAHPALAVESAAALRELARRLEGAGHVPEWDDALPGRLRCYVSDPFGNRLELLQA